MSVNVLTKTVSQLRIILSNVRSHVCNVCVACMCIRGVCVCVRACVRVCVYVCMNVHETSTTTHVKSSRMDQLNNNYDFPVSLIGTCLSDGVTKYVMSAC